MMENNSYSKRYVLAAVNEATGMRECYCRQSIEGNLVRTGSIWNARFMMSLRSAKRVLKSVQEWIPCNDRGESLEWKICEVRMSAPVELEIEQS